jgi:hypothetical protein
MLSSYCGRVLFLKKTGFHFFEACSSGQRPMPPRARKKARALQAIARVVAP